MPALHIPRSHRFRRLYRPSDADIAFARLARNDTSATGVARRAFLQGSLALGGAAGLTLTPGLLDEIAAASTPLAPTERILVTVFLNGGNDHLNTLIPAENGAYHDARGSLAVSVDEEGVAGFLEPADAAFRARRAFGLLRHHPSRR